MIWTIVKKEFFSHLLTFRVWAAAVLCFVLIPLTLYVSIQRYEEKVRNYNADVERYTQELHEARVYSYVRPTIVRPPEVLSILCSGIEDNVGSVVPIRLGTVPFLPTGEVYGQDNPFMAAFGSVDMAFILLIVISLFSLLLTYDAISGEKERGMLKQILSNPVFRHHLFLAKYLGALLVMLPLLFLSFFVAALMMLLSTFVQLSTDHFIRIGFLLLLACLYSSVFLLIGILISSRTSRSSVGLMMSLFAWVLLVILTPNLSLHLVEQINPVASMRQIGTEITELNQERDKMAEEKIAQLPPPRFPVNMYFSPGADGGVYMSGTYKERFDWKLKEVAIRDDLQMHYAEKKNEIMRRYVDALMKQRQLAGWIATVSPAALFQETFERLAGVSGSDLQRFMRDVREYRSQIVGYLRQKQNSYRYITPDDEKVIRPINEWLFYWTNGRFATFENLSRGRTPKEYTNEFLNALDRTKLTGLSPDHFPPVDLSGLPVFRFQQREVSEELLSIFYRIIVILLVNGLLFYLAHRSFITYDAR